MMRIAVTFENGADHHTCGDHGCGHGHCGGHE